MSNILGEIAARRGFNRIVHVHCDHFEPELAVHKGLYNPRRLKTYLLSMRPARPSLFFMPSFCVLLNHDAKTEVVASSKFDPVVFCEFSGSQKVQQCLEVGFHAGADIHVHLHHELWTQNQCVGQKLFPRPQERLEDKLKKRLRQWILSSSNAFLDGERFSMALDLYTRWFSRVLGDEFSRNWCFVHGCWALQASDPTICTIRDEIRRLMASGCRGDFSFPAGRRHCDPTMARPFTVTPSDGEKAYDTQRCQPVAWHGERVASNLFLIWNAGRKAWWPSLDYKADHVKSACTLERVMAHLDIDAPVFDNTCFLKTHAHSMDAAYLENDWTSPLEWFRPIMVEIENLSLKAKIEVEYQTVRELLQLPAISPAHIDN